MAKRRTSGGHNWSTWHQNKGAPAFRFKWCYDCKIEVEKEWGSTYQKPDPIPPCKKQEVFGESSVKAFERYRKYGADDPMGY